MNQTKDDYHIYDHDDKAIANWLQNNSTRAQLLPFSIEKKMEKGAYIEDEYIIIKTDSNTIKNGNYSIGFTR